MDNHFILTDDILWDYADGLLSASEKAQVEAYLKQHPELAQKLERVLTEKRNFQELSLERPDKGFADRLMAAWVTEQTHARAQARKPDWVLSSIALVFGLFLLVAIGAILMSAPENSFGIPDNLMPEMPSFDLSGALGNPMLRFGVMLILAFLGLQILDKYLQQKKQTGLA